MKDFEEFLKEKFLEELGEDYLEDEELQKPYTAS